MSIMRAGRAEGGAATACALALGLSQPRTRAERLSTRHPLRACGALPRRAAGGLSAGGRMGEAGSRRMLGQARSLPPHGAGLAHPVDGRRIFAARQHYPLPTFPPRCARRAAPARRALRALGRRTARPCPCARSRHSAREWPAPDRQMPYYTPPQGMSIICYWQKWRRWAIGSPAC